jgi:oligopeptide transport system substrate-binding protein
MSRIFATLFLALLPLTLFAATKPEADKTFRVRLAEDLSTLDWNYGEMNPEVAYQLMEGLFRADHHGKPVGAAARFYHFNPGKTELTIQLQPDRKWSDGSPLCAQQFVDSWSRLRSKEFASPYAHYAHVLKSFEAHSCRELKVTFNRPAPEALALLSHYVFFPIRLDNLAENPKVFSQGKGLIVNGPFQVVEWKRGEHLALEPNPHYAGLKPAISRLEFLFVPDDSTAKVMFEEKRVDWMRDLPPLLRTATLERSPEFHVFPQLTVYYFGLNAGKSKLLEDPEVRAALSSALDRRELSKVLGRENRGVTAWLPPELFAGLRPAHLVPPSPALKEKLAQSVKDGKMDLQLRIYNKSAHKLLAEWAQGQWERKLGIRIPIDVQDGKVYWKEITTNPAPIFLSGVTAPYGHPRAFLQEFLSTSTANWTGWKSEEYDHAVNSEDFREAESLLEKNGFVMPLYERDAVALVQRKWKNFFINPLGQVFLETVR